MISTRNIITGISDISSAWIFEKYITYLPERLCGQSLKILSPLNAEKTPSFQIVCNKGVYYFRCFSTGQKGSAVDFVQLLHKMDKRSTIALIMRDYKNHVEGNPSEDTRVIKQHGKWQVTGQVLRVWNEEDKRYWRRGFITKALLEEHNIAAIQSYEVAKEVDEVTKSFKVEGSLMFGYFRKDGSLYKIYQPTNTKNKFFKVQSGYIQGHDQLKYKEPNLLILSSMKDALTFLALRIGGWEIVAPDSENVLIPQADMTFYKSKYKEVRVLMDEDKAGHLSMEKYKDKFGLREVKTELGYKDVFDSVVALGQEKVKTELSRLLS